MNDLDAIIEVLDLHKNTEVRVGALVCACGERVSWEPGGTADALRQIKQHRAQVILDLFGARLLPPPAEGKITRSWRVTQGASRQGNPRDTVIETRNRRDAVEWLSIGRDAGWPSPQLEEQTRTEYPNGAWVLDTWKVIEP